MPTYEYLCQSCGNRFDAWQKISDEPIETCPTCEGPVRRVIFPVGLMFKGPGFYSTDTRGSSTAATPSGTAEKPAAAETSTNGSSGESKPATATTTTKATSGE